MNTTPKCFDIVIIGAGIMGLSIAKTIMEQNSDLKIAVIEKEPTVGLHASGRNSGVLHSGIYYDEGSLKAKFCSEGGKDMAFYCEEHCLPIKRIGKVILPLKPDDITVLSKLLKRATTNGAKAHLIDAKELHDVEPYARADFNMALFAPETSIVDPKAIVMHLQKSLVAKGVTFYFNSPCTQVDVKNKKIIAGRDELAYGHLFNTAGLYADKIAAACGVEDRYAMLPIKGFYYQLSQHATLQLNHLVYPVPDMNVPFLGIHSTTALDGTLYFGPSAVPVLGREHYSGIRGVRLNEAWGIFANLAKHYAANKQGFRHYTHRELPRLLQSNFLKAAQALIPKLEQKDLVMSKKVGIRAQLIDTIKKELVMDFLIEQSDHETHVLNAVSPAFTSAFSFARYLVAGSSI